MKIRVGFGIFLCVLGCLCNTSELDAQGVPSGRRTFETRCGPCHGADGGGADMGPSIVFRLPKLEDRDLTKLVREGLPTKGMPPNPVPAPRMAALVKFLRMIQREAPPPVRMTVQTTDGRTLEGQLLGEGLHDLQLRTDDKQEGPL